MVLREQSSKNLPWSTMRATEKDSPPIRGAGGEARWGKASAGAG